MGGAVEALTAYRALLRETRKTFAGDTQMLEESAAMAMIRRKFKENSDITFTNSLRRLARPPTSFPTPSSKPNSTPSRGGYEVKPTKEHAGAMLEIPSEEILNKSSV